MHAIFSATVFHISDLEVAFNFYIRTLGFKKAFQAGDYAGVCSGEVMIHLCGPKNEGHKKPIGASHLCLLIEEPVDTYYKLLQQNGVQIIYPIGDRDYGIRDFAIQDPDGNTLIFGNEMKEIC